MRTELRNTPAQFFVLMRFHKPIGIFLLLWPSLWALWIASNGAPDLLILSIFIIGTILMRAAGCVMNDIADRHLDKHVTRTRSRPLATGRVSLPAAISVMIALSATAFALVFFLNVLTIKLAVIGGLLAVIYPFMKRYTHWPQLILGLAFSWGIPMAFAAQTGQVPMIAWLLFSASVLWTITYDTEYAMTDRADDLKIGIKSTAILFGRFDRWVIGVIQITMLALFVVIGQILAMQVWYYVGIAIAAGLALYQQRLIHYRDPQRCLRAFLNNNWLGCAIFIGIFLNY